MDISISQYFEKNWFKSRYVHKIDENTDVNGFCYYASFANRVRPISNDKVLLLMSYNHQNQAWISYIDKGSFRQKGKLNIDEFEKKIMFDSICSFAVNSKNQLVINYLKNLSNQIHQIKFVFVGNEMIDEWIQKYSNIKEQIEKYNISKSQIKQHSDYQLLKTNYENKIQDYNDLKKLKQDLYDKFLLSQKEYKKREQQYKQFIFTLKQQISSKQRQLEQQRNLLLIQKSKCKKVQQQMYQASRQYQGKIANQKQQRQKINNELIRYKQLLVNKTNDYVRLQSEYKALQCKKTVLQSEYKTLQQKKSILQYSIQQQTSNNRQLNSIISDYQSRIQQLQKQYQQQKLSNNKKILSLQQQIYNLKINKLFEGNLLDDYISYKINLKKQIQKLRKMQITHTKLLYKFDSFNITNFHKYIDYHQDIILIVKTSDGNFIAGFTQSPFDPKIVADRPGFIMSLTNNKIFYLRNGCRAITYDDYYIIFGNSQIRIRNGQLIVFSNLGISNSYFENQGLGVSVFFRSNQRQINIQTYQIHQIFLK